MFISLATMWFTGVSYTLLPWFIFWPFIIITMTYMALSILKDIAKGLFRLMYLMFNQLFGDIDFPVIRIFNRNHPALRKGKKPL